MKVKTTEYEIANNYIRLFAWVIDIFIILGFIELLKYLLKFDDSTYITLFMYFMFLYFVLSEHIFQTTIGKRLNGLYVLDESKEKISFFQALCRHFFWYLSSLIIIGNLMALWKEDRRTFQDNFTSTQVLSRKIKLEFKITFSLLFFLTSIIGISLIIFNNIKNIANISKLTYFFLITFIIIIYFSYKNLIKDGFLKKGVNK